MNTSIYRDLRNISTNTRHVSDILYYSSLPYFGTLAPSFTSLIYYNPEPLLVLHTNIFLFVSDLSASNGTFNSLITLSLLLETSAGILGLITIKSSTILKKDTSSGDS